MLFVTVLYVLQYVYSLVVSGRLDKDFLETSFECSVFLYVVTILIECCRTDTLYNTSCKSRFHNIGSIHTARCTSGSNKCMYFVNKYNYIMIFLYLFQQCLYSFLKLSSVLSTRNDCCHIQTYDTFII